jgi:hypothetical protein
MVKQRAGNQAADILPARQEAVAMSIFVALRGFAFVCLISSGLATAAWSGLKDVRWPIDSNRGDVVWIDTAR